MAAILPIATDRGRGNAPHKYIVLNFLHVLKKTQLSREWLQQTSVMDEYNGGYAYIMYMQKW